MPARGWLHWGQTSGTHLLLAGGAVGTPQVAATQAHRVAAHVELSNLGTASSTAGSTLHQGGAAGGAVAYRARALRGPA